jgi:SAM-dependent methyltransferase
MEATAPSGKRSEVLCLIAERHTRYLNAVICTEVSAHDDMYHGDMAQYMMVGASAVDLVVSAMVLARCASFANILDLPCGGGRVTRHLAAMFPDAQLFASDLDKAKENFVLRTFGAAPIAQSPDFSEPPQQRFDLIFVGSLLTHLTEQQFRRASNWFLDALAAQGILIATTHGRKNASYGHYQTIQCYRACYEQYTAKGFGFTAYDQSGDTPDDPMAYGNTLVSPSWVLQLVESRPDARVLGFTEAGWADHHDVLIMQKLPAVPFPAVESKGDETPEVKPLATSKRALPPIEFIRYTCGYEDYDEYQRSGLEVFTMIDLAARHFGGKPVCEFERVLDFGCGAGRIMQYVPCETKLYGCDVNKPVVSFARNNYLHATVYNNDPEPPLDFRDGLFDLVYAFSVFSHLPHDVETRWLRELQRVGALGCLYLITIHGDWFIEATLGAERAPAEAAGFYYRSVHTRQNTDLDLPEGYEASYHTSDYIRRTWSHLFQVCGVIRGDDPSNYLWADMKFAPEGNVRRFRPMGQDLVVLRKR